MTGRVHCLLHASARLLDAPLAKTKPWSSAATGHIPRSKHSANTRTHDLRREPASRANVLQFSTSLLTMLPSKICLTVVLSLAAFASTATAAADAPDFTPLFNGTSFDGWTVPTGDNGHWKIADGVIDYDAQSEAPGDKNLWSKREFADFELRVEWRIKETPYINPRVHYILPDGTHARDTKGKTLLLSLPDSDSGIVLRGDVKNQVNIWCWPIGSGELYGFRTDEKSSAETRAAVTPRTQADKPVGEWNVFEITVRGDRVNVVLNGTLVIDQARLPGMAARGPVGLQHHGSMKDGRWTSPPALVQFRNISIKELGVPPAQR
jgi:hypothetical protein